MLMRTHFAISLFFLLLFFSFVDYKVSFVSVLLLSTILPDVDSRFSTVGRKKIARVLQFFTQHRGLIHSFTFLIIVTLFFVIVFPIFAFPFFLGYSLHLMADSFTFDGITPFYPSKLKVKGIVRTGGKTESLVLVFFLVCSAFLFMIQVSRIF